MEHNLLNVRLKGKAGGVNSCVADCYKPESELQSTVIDCLRFPLAIAVIFIHMNPVVVNLIDADFPIISGQGIYNLIGIIFSHVIVSIAVPTFFLISGYLFFVNMRKWSWDSYKVKLHKRYHTLLIPYLCWNITPWLVIIIVMLIYNVLTNHSFDNLFDYLHNHNLNILYNVNHWGETRTNWLGTHLGMTGPLDLPLWFLRDLIVMIFLSPLIYLWIKKLKVFGVLLFMFAYISRIWPFCHLPGFNITAFFFFTLGAFFSINNIYIIKFAKKLRFYLLAIAIPSFIICVIYDGSNTSVGENFMPLYTLCGTLLVFDITAILVNKYQIIPNKILVSSCFFVYALHGIIIPFIGYSPLHLCYLFISNFIPLAILDYMITPFITAITCVVFLQICKLFIPNFIKFYSGNR